jgi:hypothetical protein
MPHSKEPPPKKNMPASSLPIIVSSRKSDRAIKNRQLRFLYHPMQRFGLWNFCRSYVNLGKIAQTPIKAHSIMIKDVYWLPFIPISACKFYSLSDLIFLR